MTNETIKPDPLYPHELELHAQQITDPAALKRITDALVCAIAELQSAAPAPLKSEVGDALFNGKLYIEFTARTGEGLTAVVRLPSGKVRLPEPAKT